LEKAMRKALSIAIVALFGSVLAAQSTTGIRISKVVHEPTEEDVGPYIKTQTIANPDFDPLQPTGQPQTIPAWGNGRGISNELDSISSELYALGGTTTHDLLVMTNTTGADIPIDTAIPPLGPGPGVVVTEIKAGVIVPSAPEQISPGHLWMLVIPYEAQQVQVPTGSTVAVWMLVTKWRDQLDTSPRDYIVTFQFENIAAMAPGPKVVDVPLTIPRKDGANSPGCSIDTQRGFPQGAALLAGGAVLAVTRRRRVLARA
jgi:hypothetical protein